MTAGVWVALVGWPVAVLALCCLLPRLFEEDDG